jgi:hypothetical protein
MTTDFELISFIAILAGFFLLAGYFLQGSLDNE